MESSNHTSAHADSRTHFLSPSFLENNPSSLSHHSNFLSQVSSPTIAILFIVDDCHPTQPENYRPMSYSKLLFFFFFFHLMPLTVLIFCPLSLSLSHFLFLFLSLSHILSLSHSLSLYLFQFICFFLFFFFYFLLTILFFCFIYKKKSFFSLDQS